MTELFEISVRGLTLRGLTWGEPSHKTPVVLVHGWMDNAASFRHFHVIDDRVCFAIEMAGHGRSEHRSRDAEYHYFDYVVDLLLAIDALEIERCVFVGHSMGAGITALAAATRPQLCEKLVLIEGLGPLTTSAQDAPSNFAQAMRSRGGEPRQARHYESLDEIVSRKHAAAPMLTEDAVRALVSRGAIEDENGWRFSHDPRLKERSLLRFTDEQVVAFFEEIEAPTLLVRAESGLAYDAASMQRRLDAFGDRIQVVQVPGGHHAHLVQPDQINRLVREFID